MAINTEDIEVIASTLGYTKEGGYYNIFNMCVYSAINKWSRYKPVRDPGRGDNLPGGFDGKFGLNLTGSNPNKWDYNKPRGGSYGGNPDEPARPTDFKGYEHNKALTDPPVYADSTPVSGDLMPTTKDENVLPWQGVFRFGKNTAHGNIRVLPSDIGVDGYYWGLRLTPPSGIANYYKTLGNLNDNALFTFNLKFTDPASIAFVNFPANTEQGVWSWQLFISSTQAAAWTTTAPFDIIYLPTDADIPRLISSGTFNLLAYIVFGKGDPYAAVIELPVAGNFSASATTKTSGYEYAIVNTNSANRYTVSRSATWFHYAIYNSSNIQVCTDDNYDADALDTTRIRVWCDQNTGATRVGTLTLANDEGGSYEVSINQIGAPPIVNIQSASGWGVTLNDHILNAGDTDLWVSFTVTGMPTSPNTVYWSVKRNGVVKASGTWSISNGVNAQKWITLTESAVSGANYYLDINDGS